MLKEALENYNNAAKLGRECRAWLLSSWKGLVKTYWWESQILSLPVLTSHCSNIGHCLNSMGKFAEAEEMCYKWELLLYLDIMATLFLWQNWFHWAFELARSQQKCHGQVILGQLVLTPSSPRATFAFPLPWLGLYLFYLTKWHAWLRQSKGNTDLAIWALCKGKVCFRGDVFIPLIN